MRGFLETWHHARIPVVENKEKSTPYTAFSWNVDIAVLFQFLSSIMSQQRFRNYLMILSQNRNYHVFGLIWIIMFYFLWREMNMLPASIRLSEKTDFCYVSRCTDYKMTSYKWNCSNNMVEWGRRSQVVLLPIQLNSHAVRFSNEKFVPKIMKGDISLAASSLRVTYNV